MSRRWVQKLVARYLAEGEAAFEPRSRRPHTSPRRTGQATEDAIVALRKGLAGAGLDAGAETIAWHLRQQADSAPSVATIWRILSRRGFVTPQPYQRPRSSCHRFAADLPNECCKLVQQGPEPARNDPGHARRLWPTPSASPTPSPAVSRRRWRWSGIAKALAPTDPDRTVGP